MADQSRRTLKKTLRHPSPAIEAWLARVPSTSAKLSPEEIRQWQHDNEGRSGRGWFVCSIVLRVLSLVSAFILAVMGLDMLGDFFYSGRYRLAPIIVPGIVVSVWDVIDFVVVCARRSHRGMLRGVHLPADGLICMLLAISIAGFFIFIFNDGYWFDPDGEGFWYSRFDGTAVKYVVVLIFLLILVLIHATFFFVLLCSRRFGRSPHIFSPRIMYLPGTGEPVVVLAHPFPPGASHQQAPRVPSPPSPPSPSTARGLGPFPTIDSGAGSKSPLALHDTALVEAREEEYPPAPAPAPAAGRLHLAALTLDDGRKESSLQAVPPRKPVPGPRSKGTHYATPWPPGHVPDEAEQARAARGEAQAQWMSLGGPRLDLEVSKDTPAEHGHREGEKSDLLRSTMAQAVRKP